MKTTSKKLISSMLCAALTVHIGMSLYVNDTSAAETGTGEIMVSTVGNGYHVTLFSNSSHANFDIESDGNSGWIIYNRNPREGAAEQQDIPAAQGFIDLTASGSVTVNINTSVDMSLLSMDSEYTYLNIKSGATLECSEMSGIGVVTIDGGTLKMSSFDSSGLYQAGASQGVLIYNNGVIEADTVDITDMYMLRNNSSSTYKAHTSFTKGEEDFEGTVIATSGSTYISSEGGSFTLQYGGLSKEIEGDVSGTVGDILFEDTTTTLNIPAEATTVYVGQDYDFTDYVTVEPEEYTGTPYIVYNDPRAADETAYADRRPSAPGNYRARAVAPEVEGYFGSMSESQDFTLSYLPLSEVDSDGEYATLGGTSNDYYVSDSLRVVPPAPFLIADDSGEYTDYLEFDSEDDLFNADGNVDDINISFKSMPDGAETEYYPIAELIPQIVNIVFDGEYPEIGNFFIDGVEASIEDSQITGESASFSVYDENLSKVFINDELVYERRDGDDPEQTFTIESVAGEAKEFSITAIDLADRSATESFTFYPNPVDPRLVVTVPDTILVDTDYEIGVDTNSDGTVGFSYATDSGLALESKPDDVGTYVVTVYVAATRLYNEARASKTFTISKPDATATISVADSYVGDRYEPVYETDSDGGVVIEYKVTGAPDNTYTTTKPSAKGSYTVRITVSETDSYKSTSATSTFTIMVRPVDVTVTISDQLVGTDFTPVVVTVSDGRANTVFEYKDVSAPDAAYTTTRPINSGNYVVRATVPETATYARAVDTAEFRISFLPAPATAYGMSGTPGENGYFTSDVELTAPQGYTISSGFRGEYGESIPYSDNLNVIYLKRDSDGALTAAIAVSNRPLIDKDTPVITDQSGTLATGSTLYVKDLTITASDDNLVSLTINGEKVDLTQGNKVVLSPGNGIMTFTIIAIDKAGNICTVEVTLMAEWLRDRVIPPDLLLPLNAGEGYNLNSGSWKVVTEDGDEDPTVYSGGNQVFVDTTGNYTFSTIG
ncbi:MAG: hypothetical protein IKE53_02375 [Clostridiales bacterium]|nr:hypothetical protein [Clostridiales bacterium]